MVRKKSGSHRQSLKHKYKVDRKCKQWRKNLRKNGGDPSGRPKLKKDLGIPNLWPFKEQLLDEIAAAKAKDTELRKSQKDKRAQALAKKRRQLAQKEMEAKKSGFFSDASSNNSDVSKRHWYFKEMKKVVETADVILEVLDARDPMGCRCPEVERMIQASMNKKGAQNKKLILVLNKIDLVPAETVTKWVSVLRREFPAVAFKASTQQQKGNLTQSQSKFKATKAGKSVNNDGVDMSGSVGAGALMQILKNYSRSLNLKKNIVVGLIGFPNVGKSSIINSLKRSRAVGVSATPGFTKALQLVKLDKTITIIDSPGVIFQPEEGEDTGLFLRNCVRVEQIEDPEGAVAKIVSRCDKEALMKIYKIAAYDNHDEFLFHVAHARGKLGKGGVPNMTLAARSVIQDWNDGKIPFFTPAPEIKDTISSEVVSSFSKEFNIADLLRQSDKEVAVERGEDHKQFLKLSQAETADAGMEDEDMDDEDDEEEEAKPEPKLSIRMKAQGKKQQKADAEAVSHYTGADANNAQRNKALKKKQKKLQKEKRRLASMMDSAKDSSMQDDSYSFATDFNM